MTPSASGRPRPGIRHRVATAIPGLLVVSVLAATAQRVGHLLPLLGAPVAGILMGVALSRPLGHRTSLQPGLRFAAHFLLQIAVALLGTQLTLVEVANIGLSSVPVMVGTLVICLLVGHYLGRRMGIGPDLRTLIAVGTGICGASAIAAVSPVIRARSSTVAYAITTIFCFNVAAVLLFPPLGHLLGLNQDAFGLFAGTAVNDTSSVVAAATTYGPEATNHAVVIKLTRTLMIVPITLFLGVRTRRSFSGDGGRRRLVRRTAGLVPWFLVGFVVLVALTTSGEVPHAAQQGLRAVSVWLITFALTAIGLSTDLGAVRRAGTRPVLLGGLLWAVVTATSLALQWAAS